MLHNEITRSVCQMFGEHRVLGYITGDASSAARSALQGYLGVKERKVAALLEQQVRGWLAAGLAGRGWLCGAAAARWCREAGRARRGGAQVARFAFGARRWWASAAAAQCGGARVPPLAAAACSLQPADR
jgi:hypothetical protein